MVITRTRALGATALIALSSLAFIQCGGDQKAPDAPTMPSAEPPSDQPFPQPDAGIAQTPQAVDTATPTEGTKAPEPKPEALSDAQIAAITDAVNSAEIAQAKVAQTKSKDAAVKSFAAMMITHHGEAKQKQEKLKLKTEESGISTAMHADADNTLKALRASAGKDFDATYIKTQVDGHQKVLDAINDKLMPNAKDAKLKAYLEEIKPTVESHLKQAKQLQQSLESKSSTSATQTKPAG